MNAPLIHGHFVSSNRIVQAAGDALSRIRHEDRLTWHDLGSVLGKSEDQAAKYADGTAEMGLVACFRAKQAWGERFVGGINALLTGAGPVQDPQASQSAILKAALALSVALEDGDLSIKEIQANRSTLETARDAIDAQLSRLTPRVA